MYWFIQYLFVFMNYTLCHEPLLDVLFIKIINFKKEPFGEQYQKQSDKPHGIMKNKRFTIPGNIYKLPQKTRSMYGVHYEIKSSTMKLLLSLIGMPCVFTCTKCCGSMFRE